MDGWTPIVFDTPIAVTTGEKLALVLSADGGNDGSGPTLDSWAASSTNNPYARGAGFYRASTSYDVPAPGTWSTVPSQFPTTPDLGFADFVIPTATPEPCVTGVAGAAMALLALWQIRRRRAQI